MKGVGSPVGVDTCARADEEVEESSLVSRKSIMLGAGRQQDWEVMLLDGLLREGTGCGGTRRRAPPALVTCMTKRRGATVLDLRSMKEKMMRDCFRRRRCPRTRRRVGEHLADRLCDGEELLLSSMPPWAPFRMPTTGATHRARLVVDDLRALEVGMPVELFLAVPPSMDQW